MIWRKIKNKASESDYYNNFQGTHPKRNVTNIASAQNGHFFSKFINTCINRIWYIIWKVLITVDHIKNKKQVIALKEMGLQHQAIFDCYKTKTVVILVSHKRHRQSRESVELKLEGNTCSRCEAGRNLWEWITIGFDFICDWLKKWQDFF